MAESWEIAGLAEGTSVVREGPLAGRSLREVVERYPREVIGASGNGEFPLLVKLLDAAEWLSVQVHPGSTPIPGDPAAASKSEVWIVLSAEPGAEIIVGLRPGSTTDELAELIDAGSPLEGLARRPVEAGDVVFVPPGTVHALGPGVVVAEIQEASDTTYRLYDWDRDRPLHVDQALAALSDQQVAISRGDGSSGEIIASCPAFEVRRMILRAGESYGSVVDGRSFAIIGAIQGSIGIQSGYPECHLAAVDWALLPASLGEFQVVASTDATVLVVTVP